VRRLEIRKILFASACLVLLILGSLGALLSCRGVGLLDERVLQPAITLNLQVAVENRGPSVFLTVSGLSGNSAMVVKSTKTVVHGDEMEFLALLHLGSASERERGDFKSTFEIPHGVNAVYFGQGKSRARIWTRPPY
jgi:hypothetical protein